MKAKTDMLDELVASLTDGTRLTSELAIVPDYVVLTGLDSADETALEQQRDSIIAHLLVPAG